MKEKAYLCSKQTKQAKTKHPKQQTMMKKTFLTLFMGCAAAVAIAQTAMKPAIPRDAAIEKKIEKTLAKMTLDEKIGQMLELNLDVMGKMTMENPKIDREKVRRGIRFACLKRDVPDEKIEAIADAVAKHVGEAGGEPVPTGVIGDIVSARLRALDEVAYLRYVSLFRRWRDAAQFLAEIENLIRQ